MYLSYKLNSQSDAVNRQMNSLIVDNTPQALQVSASTVHEGARLQQLLQTEIGMQLLEVIELPDRV